MPTEETEPSDLLRWDDRSSSENDQRVSPAPQHQLLQVPDLGPVLLLRRLEDPLPQPPYLLLLRPPVDLVPLGGCALFPGPVLRSVRCAGHRNPGHGGTDPGAAIPYRGGEAVTRHRV